MTVVISRKEAIKQQQKFYYTNNACVNGHFSLRRVNDYMCVECQQSIDQTDYHAEYYRQHRDNLLAYQQEYKQTNKDTLREANKQYYNDNIEVCRARGLKYLKDNPGLVAAYSAKRRAAKKSATPVWSDTQKIKQIYVDASIKQAQEGVEYHVDHIIPLQNKLVCGLHVVDNLQIITAVDNLIKGNSFSII